MAITHVQTVNVHGAGVASVTTAGITTTTGNLVVVNVAGYLSTDDFRLTDSYGNQFIQVTGSPKVLATRFQAQYYAKLYLGGASHTFTLTGEGGGAGSEFLVMFVSEYAVADSFDVAAANSTTSSVTTLSSGTTATRNFAAEVLIGGLCLQAAGTTTFTAGSGYTIPTNGSYGTTGSGQCGATEYQVVSSTGTNAADWTWSPANANNIAIIGTYYESGTWNGVACDGDSLTFGTQAAVAGAYPAQLLATLGAGWSAINSGVSAQTLVQMEADAATKIDAAFNASCTKNICVIWGGTNDLVVGGVTGATAYSRLQTYCSSRRSAGWKIVVVTMLPRSDGDGNFETYRASFNSSVVSNWGSFADGLADIAADSRIGDAGDNTDATYYAAGGVHLNATGQAIVAGIVKTAMDGISWGGGFIPFPIRRGNRGGMSSLTGGM